MTPYERRGMSSQQHQGLARFAGVLASYATAALLAVGVLSFPRSAWAIDVEQVRWGFDGQVVANRFHPLSLLIRNSSPDPVDLILQLRKSNAGSERIGANLQEQIFLSPFASRWVQFYPHVSTLQQEWTVVWGRGAGERLKLPTPRRGRPACVLLFDQDELSNDVGPWRGFPDQLFPPLVTATDTLEAVLLDHVPRWQKARRQAFLDWLYRGGTLHLLHGSDGDYPEFTAELAELNAPLEKFRVGAGYVHRHPRMRHLVDEEFMTALFGQWPRSRSTTPSWEVDQSFFGQLAQMTKPDHNWYLIHALSLSYLALICPGWYLLARRRIDYRITLVAFLVLTLLFSAAFGVVGRRGYGETTAVHAVAIARPLAGGSYDVTQWSNVFVTRGDQYRISHQGASQLYSTCQQMEAVNGIIDNGRQGVFLVDIPLFSSRAFAHRVKMSGPPIDLKVHALRAEADLQELVLDVGASFPPDVERIQALYRNGLYEMSQADGQLRLQRAMGPVSRHIHPDQYAPWQFGYARRYGEEPGRAERFREMFSPLMARGLDVTDLAKLDLFALPADRVRLLVYARMPENFYIRNDRLGQQSGRVLYVIDVFKPESS